MKRLDDMTPAQVAAYRRALARLRDEERRLGGGRGVQRVLIPGRAVLDLDAARAARARRRGAS